MKRQALDTLKAAIEANTERKSLDDLKKQGKRHVRVVSGERVMQIIKAVVADIIDREVGELSQRDRERIEQRTKQEFDRVLKLQAGQDALLQSQKQLVDEYKEKLQRVAVTVQQADQRIEQMRDDLVQRDLEVERLRAERNTLATRSGEDSERLEQTQDALRRAELDVERLRGEQDSQSKHASKSSKQVDALNATLVERELEGKRLQSELETLQRRSSEDAERLTETSETLKQRDLELERMRGERDMLQSELAAVREAAGDSEAVSSFRDELSAMREYLTSMEARSDAKEDSTINTLLQKLDEQSRVDASGLEERFSGTLDDALDRITRTMEAATAKPIDIVVEATDVLVDKLFDMEETEMSTNLDKIDIEEKSSKSSIARNLDALRKMRGAAAADDAGEKASEEEKAESEGEEVSKEENIRVNASIDRLKAVREGSASKKK